MTLVAKKETKHGLKTVEVALVVLDLALVLVVSVLEVAGLALVAFVVVGLG